MNTEQIEALKALAEAATAGPWTALRGDGELDLRARFETEENVLVMAMADCKWHPVADCSTNASCRLDYDQAANAAYIAAANPTAILALIASATVSEGRIAELTDDKILKAAEDSGICWVTDERRPDNATIIDFARSIAALAGSATPSVANADEVKRLCEQIAALRATAPAVYAPVQAQAYRHGYRDAARVALVLTTRSAAASAAPQDTLKNADSEDAARYRWVRTADYAKLDAIKDKRWKGLDEAIDAAMAATQAKGNGE